MLMVFTLPLMSVLMKPMVILMENAMPVLRMCMILNFEMCTYQVGISDFSTLAQVSLHTSIIKGLFQRLQIIVWSHPRKMMILYHCSWITMWFTKLKFATQKRSCSLRQSSIWCHESTQLSIPLFKPCVVTIPCVPRNTILFPVIYQQN